LGKKIGPGVPNPHPCPGGGVGQRIERRIKAIASARVYVRLPVSAETAA